MININACIGYLIENEGLTVPENVHFSSFEAMHQTANAVGWIPPTEDRIIEVWDLIRGTIDLNNRKGMLLSIIKEKASNLLTPTDYKVIRQRDQVELGVAPRLSEPEYKALLATRNNVRTKSNELELIVESAKTQPDLDSVELRIANEL